MTKNILKFTTTGMLVGIALGWLLSRVSGNIFVVFMVGTLGLIVGGKKGDSLKCAIISYSFSSTIYLVSTSRILRSYQNK